MGWYRVELFLIYIGQIEHCDQAWKNTFLKTRTNFNFGFLILNFVICGPAVWAVVWSHWHMHVTTQTFLVPGERWWWWWWWCSPLKVGRSWCLGIDKALSSSLIPHAWVSADVNIYIFYENLECYSILISVVQDMFTCEHILGSFLWIRARRSGVA